MNNSLNDIDDFLLDEDFKSWVLNPTPDLDKYWDEFLKSNPDKNVAIAEAKKLIKGIKYKHYKEDTDRRAYILKQIKSETHGWNRPKQVKLSPMQYWVRVAAILIFSVSISYLVFQWKDSDKPESVVSNIVKKENPLGVRSHYILADGTEVYLNSGSSIEFPKNFNDDERIVKLDGEAYFEVNHDISRPFKVLSDKLSVTVLGTKFNVNSRDNVNAVALTEGSVRYTNNDSGNNVILKPGQMATFDPKDADFNVSDFDPEVIIGWKDGKLLFRDASFEEVIEKIKNWYGVDVVIENGTASTHWSYTASFRNESLETVLLNMSTIKGFSYAISNNSVTISF